MPASRPNVLWLMTDEQRTDSLGCYGSPWARTANLNGLAAQSMLFETALTPAPVCVPARASLLSGLRPHRTGIMSNVDGGGDWEPLPHVFARHGYQTATFGKQHYSGRGAFDKEVGKVLSDAVHYFNYEKNYQEEDFGAVKYPNPERPWLFAGRFPESVGNTAEAQVVGLARQWLDSRDASRPFFLRISFNGPHTPVVPPAPFDTLIDPDEIHLPEAFLPPGEGKPKWETEFMRPFAGSHRLSEDQLRRAHQCYYGLAAFLDTLFGELLDWMDHRSLLDNTIIAFVSDHGTHLGDHGLMQKQTFYEPVVNVPYFIKAPGGAAGRIKTPVETLSLLPTLLDLADLPCPTEAHSLTVAQSVRSGAEPEDRAVFSEFTQATWGYRPDDRLVLIRRGPWKLSLFYDGPGTNPLSAGADAALYNVADDPLENRNRIRDRDCRQVIDDLLAQAHGAL